MRKSFNIMVFVMMLYFGVIGLLQWQITNRPPPYRYSQNVYEPVNSILCPGDTLEAHVEVFHDNHKAISLVADTWWSVDGDYTAVPDDDVVFIINVEKSRGKLTTLQVVPQLKPGSYELRHAAQELNGTAAVFRVPFEVPEGCGDD